MSKNDAGVNIVKLREIAAGNSYVNQADGKPLLEKGFIEVNMNLSDEQGNKAARLTEAGKAYLDSADKSNTGPAGASASAFAVMTGFVAPPAKPRGNLSGAGAPDKYPFKTMEVGGFFFVPNTEVKTGDAFQSLQSTVSSANRRFSEETGETKTVKRAQRGSDHKAVLGADGKKVVEEKTIPVLKYTRKFKIVAVEAGKAYGNYTAPANGAVIYRSE